MARSFDELNVIQRKIAVPYEEYFSGMDLTKEQREERVQFSNKFEDIMLFIFSLASVMIGHGYINKEYIKNELANRYSDMARKYESMDDYLDGYIKSFSDDVINTTMKHKDDEWYMSNDRAMLISENEANTVLNHSDFANAIKSGKTKKKWIDVRDKRERESHLKVGGTVKPILEPFLVGDSLMNYPKDTEYDPNPEQVCGCRCTIKYF